MSCSGHCCVCEWGDGGCLAGHGDDDFCPTTKEDIIERLNAGRYPRYREYMIDYLRKEYGYFYQK